MKPMLYLIAVMLTVAVAFGLSADGSPATAATPPTASYDWSVPDRFGLDENGDTLIDYFPETSDLPGLTGDITPDVFPVNFNACASIAGANPIVEYRWEIDGVPAGTAGTCLGFSHDFPEEGSYQVKLTVEDSIGATHMITQTVIVQDWLIISLGDSYGSGEGNPDLPISDESISVYEGLLGQLGGYQADLGQLGLDLIAADALKLAKEVLAAIAQTAWETADGIKTSAQTTLTNAINALGPIAAVKDKCYDNFTFAQRQLCVDALNVYFGGAAVTLFNFAQKLIDLGGSTGVTNLYNAAINAKNHAQGKYNTAANNLTTALNNLGAADQAYDLAFSAWEAVGAAIDITQGFIDNLFDNLFPPAEADLVPTWQDKRCHRSAVAGSAQAALQIEQDDPKTSVTFVHLACSGAKVGVGLLEPYQGIEPSTGLIPAQVKEAALLVGDREIDAVYLSGGGNDINFGPILFSCLYWLNCHDVSPAADEGVQATLAALCGPVLTLFVTKCENPGEGVPEPALDLFNAGIATLPGLYEDLNDRLPKLLDGRVYISAYPSATKDDNEAYCDPLEFLTKPETALHFPGLSVKEAAWAQTTVVVGLNDVIEDTSEPLGEGVGEDGLGFGWNFLGGDIMGEFESHGYCAGDPWFVRLQDTFDIQGDENGTMHPNVRGQQQYRDALVPALCASFYPDGAGTCATGSPRPPATAKLDAAVSAGGNQTCALSTLGGLKCWGNNADGQLGNGTNADSNTPWAYTSGLASGVATVSAGFYQTCAVTTGGGVKCWGNNVDGELGNGTNADSNVPVNVSGLTSGVASVSAGRSHTCALTTGGGVKCWGNNFAGQLGNSTFTSSNVPVDVTGLTSGVQAVSAGGYHTCALLTGGGVKCWGYNFEGELGNGTNTNSTVPVDVSGLTSGVAAVSAGFYHTCAVTTGGGAKCWGDNNNGELGNSSNTDSNVPVDVTGLTAGTDTVNADLYHTCALTTSNGVKCWGANGSGQLGNGTNTSSNVPVDVTGLTSGVAAVSAGGVYSCALTTGGSVECWGDNFYGELGNGTNTNSNVPVVATSLWATKVGKLAFPGDTDLDGCSDERESGPDPAQGGQRDYKYPYDYYDVYGPGQSLTLDGVIDLPNDILGVIQHFSPSGAAPYDVQFDRGPRLSGPVWNMTAPDGVIDLPNDILGIIQQFGHNCV